MVRFSFLILAELHFLCEKIEPTSLCEVCFHLDEDSVNKAMGHLLFFENVYFNCCLYWKLIHTNAT